MKKLKVLLLEDDPLDAELILARLVDDGFDFETTHAQTREQFVAALETETPDLILSDYSLPLFDGTAALELARERCDGTPFIFVSGALGEELAIETLKRGATDYVLKHRLDRLAPAIHRALREREERSRRLEAERGLRESEERFRSLVQATAQMVWTTDSDGRLLESPEWLVHTGQTAEEVAGMGWLDAVHPEDREEVARLWTGAIARNEPYKAQYRLRGRDGTYRYFVSRGVPVIESDGRIREWVGTCTDVDERVRAEEERRRLLAAAEAARARAEEASCAKDEFLAMVSHELRTPLNAMMGWIRLLRSDKLDEATFRRGMDTIERNTKSQAQLIEDLLDVSRIITGKLRLDVRPVELGPVVEAALDAVRPAAAARGIHVASSTTGASGLVSGDPERLQQVVWNLLTNAIKFTPEGGEVALTVRRAGSNVEVTVADTGKGIDPDFLPYVFERFRQGEAMTGKVQGGLGLGLAIVRHIVEMHGGTVTARSEGLGKGATFSVSLPAIASQARGGGRPADEASGTMLASPQSLAGLRILVAEDEEDSREMLLLVLGECGAEVRGAASSAEALAVMSEWRPDVLVSDIGMPGADGYELIRRVRALGPERGGAIPAIALTAYARVEDRMKALEAGFHMHVGKPVEPAELVLVIDSLLKMVRRTPPTQSTAAEP